MGTNSPHTHTHRKKKNGSLQIMQAKRFGAGSIALSTERHANTLRHRAPTPNAGPNIGAKTKKGTGKQNERKKRVKTPTHTHRVNVQTRKLNSMSNSSLAGREWRACDSTFRISGSVGPLRRQTTPKAPYPSTTVLIEKGKEGGKRQRGRS